MLIALLQEGIPSRYYYQPNWVMLIIVLSLMLLGYLYSAFHTRGTNFFKSVLYTRYAIQASREERLLSHPFSILLSLNFILTASLFILQLFSSGAMLKSKIEFSILSYSLIALFLLGMYLVKLVLLRLLSFILDKQDIISEYTFTIFLVNQFLGILLLPSIIFLAYGSKQLANSLFYAGLACLILAFIFRTGKGLSVVIAKRNASLFYIILYLCTLEILPLLVGLKLLERLA